MVAAVADDYDAVPAAEVESTGATGLPRSRAYAGHAAAVHPDGDVGDAGRYGAVVRGFGLAADPFEGHPGIVEAAGRMYLDLTVLVRSKSLRARLPETMKINVITEMDLLLWQLVSAAAGEHRDLLLNTPPAELAARYLAGELPEFGLGEFLRRYGHRAAAEVDVARSAEDPTPVFAAIAGYLRVTDPEQAPARRFAQAAEEALAKIDELVARARRIRPVRGRLAAAGTRRADGSCDHGDRPGQTLVDAEQHVCDDDPAPRGAVARADAGTTMRWRSVSAR